jgi:Ni/Fe-hydrogenase subunit HybB-like protein
MVFWSQYLVFWYGNLPEEIPFVIERQNTMPWSPISYLMILISLPVPFAILLSAAVKKNPRTLAAVSAMICVGMWLERWVLIVPSLWSSGHAASGVAHNAAAEPAAAALPLPFGVIELFVTLGFAAAFCLSYAFFARAFPVTLGVTPRTHHEQM